MGYYVERKCLAEMVVEPGANVKFETLVTMTHRINDPHDKDSADFIYDEASGVIEIKRIGAFLVVWSVRQLTGLPNDGQTFQLMIQQPFAIPVGWTDFSSGSTQFKVGNSEGVGVVFKQNLLDSVKISLQNISNFKVLAAPISPIKAQILIYGIGEDQGDMQSFIERLDYLKAIWYDPELLDFETIKSYLDNIENKHTPPGQLETIEDLLQEVDHHNTIIRNLNERSPRWMVKSEYVEGFTIYVMRVGHTYHFWNDGILKATLPEIMAKMVNGKVYMIKAKDFSIKEDGIDIYPLESHGPNPTQAGCWFYQDRLDNPGEYDIINMSPIRADNTGIYFMPSEDKYGIFPNIRPGQFLRFSIELVLYSKGG